VSLNIKYLKYIGPIVTFVGIILIAAHAFFPEITIDNITLALVIIIIFAWLIPHVQTIKLLGGTELTLRNMATKLEEDSARSELIQPQRVLVEAPPSKEESSRWNLLQSDPNLALASLRIDIEKVLRQIAEAKKLSLESAPLRRILNTLHNKLIIPDKEYSILTDVINVCNRAVHAETVELQTASRILDVGEAVLIFLNSLK